MVHLEHSIDLNKTMIFVREREVIVQTIQQNDRSPEKSIISTATRVWIYPQYGTDLLVKVKKSNVIGQRF